MANYDKFTRQSLGKMLSHYDRTDEKPKEHIDRSRTHLNYNLAPSNGKQMDILEKRLSEVKVQNRADVNLLCSWVVTMPKTLPIEKEPEFFRKTYEFLEDKYGKDNVVSAYVHKDEVSPHIHFAFIPVVEDKRNDRLKVSASECVTRLDLQRFHDKLQDYLEQELDCQVDILNEATREGNKAIAELKRKSAVERIEEANEKAERIIRSAQLHAQAIEETAKPIEAEAEAKKEFLQALASEPSKRGIELKKPFLGENYYTVEVERMQELLTKEKAYAKANELNEKLTEELAEMKKAFTYNHFREALIGIDELQQTLAAEQKKSKRLQKDIDRYVQKYGVLEREQPKEEVKAKHRIRSRSRNKETSWER